MPTDEYSYNDFAKMQQQAIDRVREMQKKAMPNKPLQNGENSIFSSADEKPKTKSTPPEKINIPKESPKKPANPQQKSNSSNPLSFLSSMDSDMSLILPLLLLLGKEGADSILLLALLYIIS